MRPQRWATALLACVSVLLTAGTAGLLAVYRPGSGVLTEFGIAAGAGAAVAALGVVIGWRVAGNPIGPLLAWAGAIITFLGARPAYETVALRNPGEVPLDLRVVVLFEESAWWLLVAVSLVLLFFPDGRLPGPRWRVPWAAYPSSSRMSQTFARVSARCNAACPAALPAPTTATLSPEHWGASLRPAP